MNLFHELTRKPWLAEPGAVAGSHSGRTFSLPKEKVGLRVFLAVVTVLFSLVVIIYSDRMAFPDWRPLPEPWILWLNTVLLILASVAFQWALIAARQGQIDGVRVGLHAAGLCTFAFLVGQFWVARQLVGLGYYADTNPAAAFFYLITALHGLHLLGGLVAWGKTTARLWRGHGAAQLRQNVELCAVYWHYLLVIWVVLFGLLLST